MTDEVRKCTCGAEIVRKSGGRGPWPRICEDCKGKTEVVRRTRSKNGGGQATNGTGEVDAWDAIAAWSLPFLEGTAVHWIHASASEEKAADKIQALTTAREMVDRAIKHLEGA